MLPHSDDLHLAEDCAEGKPTALRHLQQTCEGPALAFLQRSGASPAEAAEVVNDLWADCFSRPDGKPSKLERYNGACALQTWLNTIALNHWLNRKRREARWGRLIQPHPTRVREAAADEPEETGGGVALDAVREEDSLLVKIMRDALETAFLEQPAEDFVLLLLARRDQLKVTELAVMFRCNISTISRRVAEAEQAIRDHTRHFIKKADPWLELQWPDFIELCRSATPACFGVE